MVQSHKHAAFHQRHMLVSHTWYFEAPSMLGTTAAASQLTWEKKRRKRESARDKFVRLYQSMLRLPATALTEPAKHDRTNQLKGNALTQTFSLKGQTERRHLNEADARYKISSAQPRRAACLPITCCSKQIKAHPASFPKKKNSR